MFFTKCYLNNMKFQNEIGNNGWYYSLENILTNDNYELSGSHFFDYVIVGAGFVGMAAAYRLAELAPEATIALIDATKIGLSTSGRCSGFVIDTPHKGDLLHNNKTLHKQAFKINRQGISWMEETVIKHNIDCNWNQTGKYQVAASTRAVSYLDSYKKMLDGIKEPYDVLNQKELETILGTRKYTAGVFTPGCVLIQPAAYLIGLASSLPNNVSVFENTKVISIQSTSKGAIISTNSATINCRKAVLSVNIYVREFNYSKNRVVPIVTYASMSNILTKEQQSKYQGIYDWGLTSADKGGSTLRMTQDKRLVIRNHYTYTPSYQVGDKFITKLRSKHLKGLLDRYPDLEDLKIEHTWGGVCAVSRNFGFFAGKLEDNIYSCYGHSGVGAARGSLAGKSIADEIILGKSSDLDLLRKIETPCWNPPEPLLGIGVSTRLSFERYKSRSEL